MLVYLLFAIFLFLVALVIPPANNDVAVEKRQPIKHTEDVNDKVLWEPELPNPPELEIGEGMPYPFSSPRPYRNIFRDEDGNPLTEPIPSPEHQHIGKIE